MKKIFSLLFLGLGVTAGLMAQDSVATKEVPVKKAKYVKSTFQSSSLINLQSVDIQPKGTLQFMVAHHFANVWNKGLSTGQNFAQAFGLNSGLANTYISFDYTPTKFADIGLAFAGNSSFEGWAKFKLLRQQTGARNIPVSVSWVSLVNADALSDPTDTGKNKLSWNKFSYLHQLIVARKFNSKFSAQVMGSYIHYNIVPYGWNNTNNIFSLGVGGKYQLSENKAFTVEYARQLNMYNNVMDNNGNVINYSPDLLAIGLEFNTGGHIFQFYIGNATSASNIEQLSRNTNFIKNGNFSLGFRLNRGFLIGR